MKKPELARELLLHLEEKSSNTADYEKIRALAKRESELNAVKPPDQVWRNIRTAIAAEPHPHGILHTLRGLFSTPLFPVFAVLVVGVSIASVILINRATTTHSVQIVEIAAQRAQQKGDLLIAKGLRIENAHPGGVSRLPGATEKIVFHSGEWKVALQHTQLEKPLQFVFPGGALEPLGTAFTIKISPQGTDVQLTEGKIRLLQFHSEKNTWEGRELSAPFHGVLAPQPLNTEPVLAPPPVEKKPVVPARYAPYIGKDITLELKNGDRLSGRLRSATAGRIVLAGASGNLTVRDADVVAIQRK